MWTDVIPNEYFTISLMGTDETVLMSFKSTQNYSELPVVYPTVKKMSKKLQYKGGENVS